MVTVNAATAAVRQRTKLADEAGRIMEEVVNANNRLTGIVAVNRAEQANVFSALLVSAN